MCGRAKYGEKRHFRALRARFLEKRYMGPLFWLQKWIQRPQIMSKTCLTHLTPFLELDLFDSVIYILRCLQIISSYQLPRYRFQNISECILVQSQFLVVQCPFRGTLHPCKGIHKQCPVVKILYTSIIIHIIKSQLESNTLQQSSVNMDAVTIIMLVSQ